MFGVPATGGPSLNGCVFFFPTENMEDEANKFASAFLMPERSMRFDVTQFVLDPIAPESQLRAGAGTQEHFKYGTQIWGIWG